MNFCDLLLSESPTSRANQVPRYKDALKIEWIFELVGKIECKSQAIYTECKKTECNFQLALSTECKN